MNKAGERNFIFFSTVAATFSYLETMRRISQDRANSQPIGGALLFRKNSALYCYWRFVILSFVERPQPSLFFLCELRLTAHRACWKSTPFIAQTCSNGPTQFPGAQTKPYYYTVRGRTYGSINNEYRGKLQYLGRNYQNTGTVCLRQSTTVLYCSAVPVLENSQINNRHPYPYRYRFVLALPVGKQSSKRKHHDRRVITLLMVGDKCYRCYYKVLDRTAYTQHCHIGLV